MSSPISWDDGVVPSSEKPNTIKPLYPDQSCRVWFVGDVSRVFTHYQKGTFPCMGKDCVFCGAGIPTSKVGYAPVLYLAGIVDGKEVWQARVLRVPASSLELIGSNLRGKVYHIEVGRNGAVKRLNFTYKHSKEPQCEPFSAKHVMESIWFPQRVQEQAAPQEVLIDAPPPPVPAARPAQPSLADDLKNKSLNELLELRDVFTKGGMKRSIETVEAELAIRAAQASAEDTTDQETHDLLTKGAAEITNAEQKKISKFLDKAAKPAREKGGAK